MALNSTKECTYKSKVTKEYTESRLPLKIGSDFLKFKVMKKNGLRFGKVRDKYGYRYKFIVYAFDVEFIKCTKKYLSKDGTIIKVTIKRQELKGIKNSFFMLFNHIFFKDHPINYYYIRIKLHEKAMKIDNIIKNSKKDNLEHQWTLIDPSFNLKIKKLEEIGFIISKNSNILLKYNKIKVSINGHIERIFKFSGNIPIQLIQYAQVANYYSKNGINNIIKYKTRLINKSI